MPFIERSRQLRAITHKIEDCNADWSWVDVYETDEGGARVIMGDLDLHLDTLERLDTRMKELGKNVEMDVNKNETGFVLMDNDGSQVPFDIIIQALFDTYSK